MQTGGGGRRRIVFKQRFDATQLQAVARLKHRLLHGRMLQKSPVGRTEVFQEDRTVIHNDLTVRGGDGRVLEDELIGRATPECVHPRLELDFPLLRRSGVDDESRHSQSSHPLESIREYVELSAVPADAQIT